MAAWNSASTGFWVKRVGGWDEKRAVRFDPNTITFIASDKAKFIHQ